MATETQRERFRLDMGFAADDTDGLPDETIDDLYDEAGETYTDDASIHAYTRVIYIGRLMIQAANEVDYTQNNTSEKASQRYTHLEKELAKWQGRLDDAISTGRGSGVKSGRTTRKPSRIKEYPGAWGW